MRVGGLLRTAKYGDPPRPVLRHNAHKGNAHEGKIRPHCSRSLLDQNRPNASEGKIRNSTIRLMKLGTRNFRWATFSERSALRRRYPSIEKSKTLLIAKIWGSIERRRRKEHHWNFIWEIAFFFAFFHGTSELTSRFFHVFSCLFRVRRRRLLVRDS